jgi:acid phosphatase
MINVAKTNMFTISTFCIMIFVQVAYTQQPWSSCSSQTSCSKKVFSCNQPENITLAHKKVMDYYENGCFEQELTNTVKQAKHIFDKPAQDNNKEVIIWDIDETALSEYCNVKAIQFGYVPKLSHEWIMKASAPAIPATKKLYQYLLKKGYRMIFLTGRHHNEYEATEKNLKKEGFTGYDRLIVRSREDKGLTAEEYKSRERAKLAEEGYTIVGSIGDQWSDLAGDNIGMAVKIPNYMYLIE